MTPELLSKILEAALMVSDSPLTLARLEKLFDETDKPDISIMRSALHALAERYTAQDSGIELRELASGWQFQSRTEIAHWLNRLYDERPPRYSRAYLETLALIAWRQPITRAEIENIRGVAVSSNIMKTLLERDWIRILGYRDVPGKPALYGTTKVFLDYFNLQSLTDLPKLAELKDPETMATQLELLQATDENHSPDQESPHEHPAEESRTPPAEQEIVRENNVVTE